MNGLGRAERSDIATHEGGDHRIFVGEVVSYDPEVEPLIFTHGSYAEVVGHRDIKEPVEEWSEPWV